MVFPSRLIPSKTISLLSNCIARRSKNEGQNWTPTRFIQSDDIGILDTLHGKKELRWPGIEPRSIAWKATMLTFTPPTPLCKSSQNQAFFNLMQTHLLWLAKRRTELVINHNQTQPPQATFQSTTVPARIWVYLGREITFSLPDSRSTRKGAPIISDRHRNPGNKGKNACACMIHKILSLRSTVGPSLTARIY